MKKKLAIVLILAMGAASSGDVATTSDAPGRMQAPVGPTSAAPDTEPPAAAPATRPNAGPLTVGVQMHNVHLRVDQTLALDVSHLQGRLVGLKKGVPPTFDDPLSYELEVDTGEVALTAQALEYLMNTYVFRGSRAPIKNIRIELKDGQLKQSGVLRKGLDVPFSAVADVRAAPDGTLQLHMTKRKTAGIPTGGLLDFFGIELEDLISARDAYGLRVEENDIFVDPSRVLPPPRMRGRLMAARIEGSRLVQVFGPSRRSASPAPPLQRANYLHFRLGTLRFGRLTMADADLELVDADPSDPFDFFPNQYQRQLVAGYSKNTASGGLLTFMPDHDQVAARPGLDLTRPLRRVR